MSSDKDPLDKIQDQWTKQARERTLLDILRVAVVLLFLFVLGLVLVRRPEGPALRIVGIVLTLGALCAGAVYAITIAKGRRQ